MAIYKHVRTILVLSSILLTTACTSTTAAIQRHPIPEEGLTVSQIYRQTTKQSEVYAQVPRYAAPHARKSQEWQGYTRTAVNETKALFKPLENPEVPIYIYPHVALIGDEQLIKPGITTAFFLYKQNQFAMASERY